MSLVVYNNNLYQLYNLNGGMQCLRKCPLIGPCFSKCLGDDDGYEALDGYDSDEMLEDSLELAKLKGNLNKHDFNDPPPRFGSHGTLPSLAKQRWQNHTSKAEQDKILKNLRRRGQASAGQGSPKHWYPYGS